METMSKKSIFNHDSPGSFAENTQASCKTWYKERLFLPLRQWNGCQNNEFLQHSSIIQAIHITRQLFFRTHKVQKPRYQQI